MQIDQVTKSEHPKLLEIWEASVRATHHILAEADLQALKPLILQQYFDAVDLRCAKNAQGDILGFCGVPEGSPQTSLTYQSLSTLTDFQSQIPAQARICRIAANICSPVIEKRASRQSRWPT